MDAQAGRFRQFLPLENDEVVKDMNKVVKRGRTKNVVDKAESRQNEMNANGLVQ